MTNSSKDMMPSDCFVKAVFERKITDHRMRAAFRHALSPNQAQQAWPYLSEFIDLTNGMRREVFQLVGSSICLDSAEQNGSLGLGEALYASWAAAKGERMCDVKKSNPAVSRLQRLLACRDGASLTRALRPVLSIIRSREGARLDYAKLLGQMLSFDWDPERIKAVWANEYYTLQVVKRSLKAQKRSRHFS